MLPTKENNNKAKEDEINKDNLFDFEILISMYLYLGSPKRRSNIIKKINNGEFKFKLSA